MSQQYGWDKTQSTWHVDVDGLGRYAVYRMRKRGPYAAFLNGERIMDESVHSDAEVVKRKIETRIEKNLDKPKSKLREIGRANFLDAAVEQERKVQVGTVDLTPTWGEILPILLEFAERGNAEQRETARTELTKMATAADAYNAMQKELNKQIGLGKVAMMELGSGKA